MARVSNCCVLFLNTLHINKLMRAHTHTFQIIT
jgi:hypothetical protein